MALLPIELIPHTLIRYADVLLMLAECYNEMEGWMMRYPLLIGEGRVHMPGINSGPWLEASTKEEV